MIKSINAWHFAAGTPLPEAARRARTAGFAAIEPTVNPEGELTPQTDEPACRRLAERVRATSLEIASLACGMFWDTPYTARDPQTRRAAHELTLACLDRARWMSAPAILVLPGVISHFERGGYQVSYADALKYAYDALQALAPEAEARGITIGVENVWNNFLVSPVEMRDFLDRVNSPWVAAYFDVGNTLRYGIPEDWISTLGPRITRVHIKDFKLSIGNINGFCLPGDGDANWPAVMAALRSAGYDGPLTYEGGGDLADISRRLDRIMEAAR